MSNRRGGPSRTIITWVAVVLSFAAGVAYGHLQLAEASRRQAFLGGETYGTYRTACQTPFALLWVYEEHGFSPEEAAMTALVLADIQGEDVNPSSDEMREVFGEGFERMAAELYRVMGLQLASAPYSVVSEPDDIHFYGRDLGASIEAVRDVWFGRSPYRDEPAEWRDELWRACTELAFGEEG